MQKKKYFLCVFGLQAISSNVGGIIMIFLMTPPEYSPNEIHKKKQQNSKEESNAFFVPVLPTEAEKSLKNESTFGNAAFDIGRFGALVHFQSAD